jgi:hypothetical protein
MKYYGPVTAQFVSSRIQIVAHVYNTVLDL